jgi:hypothetical protein
VYHSIWPKGKYGAFCQGILRGEGGGGTAAGPGFDAYRANGTLSILRYQGRLREK